MLIVCPECKKNLQVPENLLGQTVQCPECKHTFTAAEPPPKNVSTETTATPPSPPNTPEWDRKVSSATGKRRASGKDDDEKDEKKDSYDVDDRDDDDDDRADGDDEEREERRRRRRRRRERSSRNYGVPHRGGMILAFGLIGLIGNFVVLGPLALIFAIMAWVMGNTDMAEIQSGRMDPEGEGMTQTGRILGIIGTILGSLYVLALCGLIGFCFLGGIAGGVRR
jgi:predicted Zn finger-like uncharacterized protein